MRFIAFASTLALLIAMALATSTLPSVAIAAGDHFENEAACQSCLEDAQAWKDECESSWEYGEGDPYCRDGYTQLVQHCQLTYCHD